MHAGAVVWGRGLLLDHKTAATSADEAVHTCRIQVSLGPVRDWVIDYSNPLIIWVVTDTAWYRCTLHALSSHCNQHPLPCMDEQRLE